MEIKCIKLGRGVELDLPVYATLGSAGLDLRSASVETIIIEPQGRTAVPTGLAIELPEGFEAQIRSRSGLAIKNGISVLNSPGTIDSDFRGEIKVILINLSDTRFKITFGDKIAQMVVAKYEKVTLVAVSEISETSRNDKGFGSSGV